MIKRERFIEKLPKVRMYKEAIRRKARELEKESEEKIKRQKEDKIKGWINNKRVQKERERKRSRGKKYLREF